MKQKSVYFVLQLHRNFTLFIKMEILRGELWQGYLLRVQSVFLSPSTGNISVFVLATGEP